MTRSKFFSRQGLLTGFELSGHTGCADHAGEGDGDIVCAAVSSAAYMTANTITEVIAAAADVAVRDGRMRLTLTADDVPRCQVILQGFRLHLAEMQKQYPDHIQVVITEV